MYYPLGLVGFAYPWAMSVTLLQIQEGCRAPNLSAPGPVSVYQGQNPDLEAKNCICLVHSDFQRHK